MPSPRQIKVFSKYIQRHQIADRLPEHDVPESRMIVVIPAFLEKEYIFDCLKSLVNSAAKVDEAILVIIVVNASEMASEDVVREQEELYNSLQSFASGSSYPSVRFFVLKEFNIRRKHAGVGYARKIGMDQAVLQFKKWQKYDGLIVSLDADVTVAPDYFQKLIKYFSNKKASGCSIYFEHPLEGEEAGAIALYELHLRYYKQALAFTGFPYAFHTVGSAFALRADSYVMAGGMPRKQAGEDFYLIQKAAQMGGWEELNSTCVYPSSRPSDRVPFGTGPVVRDLMSGDPVYQTYAPEAFYALKDFFDKRADLYRITGSEYNTLLKTLVEPLRSFLIQDDFIRGLEHLNKNCSTVSVFEKRFFEVFNAFKVVKYLNFVHNGYYEKLPVTDAAVMLLEEMNGELPEKADAVSLLLSYRKIDKKTVD